MNNARPVAKPTLMIVHPPKGPRPWRPIKLVVCTLRAAVCDTRAEPTRRRRRRRRRGRRRRRRRRRRGS